MTGSEVRTLVLLRGINVGGHHPVAMADLRAVFAGLGCREIATYIQSGNLVCTAPGLLEAAAIARALAERFGFAIPVTLRTAAELDEVVAANPFAAQPAEQLHVVFLDETLPAAALAALGARRSGDEQLAASGRELFLLLPHGFGRSKLAAACTGPGVPGGATVRNWKTVLALEAMLRPESAAGEA